MLRPLILLAALTAASVQPDEPKWVKLEAKAEGFAVETPTALVRKTMTQKAGDGSDAKLAIHTGKDGAFTFILAVTDFADSYLKQGPEKLYDQARDAGAQRSGGKVVADKKVKVGGKAGRDFIIELPDGKGWLRSQIVLVGSRQWSILVVAPTRAEAEGVTAERLFKSFKLLK